MTYDIYVSQPDGTYRQFDEVYDQGTKEIELSGKDTKRKILEEACMLKVKDYSEPMKESGHEFMGSHTALKEL